MLRMTVRNQPDGNFKRRMAIILDDKVLSAPELNSAISGNGQISGRFTQEDVKFLVEILREGRLPATLDEVPASESRVGAGLGVSTIARGTYASIISLIITFACILAYYRFAGIIAVIALVINGLMIYGSMIFLSQPLTLAGLAGLVLTVGMSVDANVLIYERIREEVAKGSAKRMAVRNGFDRALTTIYRFELDDVDCSDRVVLDRYRSSSRLRGGTHHRYLYQYVHRDFLFAIDVRYLRTIGHRQSFDVGRDFLHQA